MSVTIPREIAEFLAACGRGESEAQIWGRSPEEKARRVRIGLAIRRRRLALGLSVEQLARKVSTHMLPRTVAEIERAFFRNISRRYRENLIERIAAALGTTSDELDRERTDDGKTD